MPSKFDRLPVVAAVLVVAVVVPACVIKLRDGEAQPQSNASVRGEPDRLAEKLERCRSLAYEQKDELGECQKVWAEKRRQFLGQGSAAPFRNDRLDAARSPLIPPADDEARVPSGRPKPARE